MGNWLYQFLLILVLVLSCHPCDSHISLVLADAVSLSQQRSTSHSYMCPDDERSALLQFKQSFIIDCATSDDPYAYPKVNSWAGEHNCCLWDGVVCDEESGHVVRLHLSSSCLYGTFPPNSTLFTLTHLRHLDLSYNNFNHSSIPSQFGLLSNLKSLILMQSQFSGQVPPEITNLSKLSLLDLSDNADLYTSLTLEYSTLENLLGNLTRLKWLYLDLVDISSSVPIILANATSIRIVSFKSCNMNGEFPNSVFQLPHLEGLNLANNIYLAGSLPEFNRSSSLRHIDISSTAFHGELPPSIGELAGLETLALPRCHLSGLIPSSLGNLTNLTKLDLSYNDFSADFPLSLLSLTQLRSLGLSNLKVTSETLMPWLVKLTDLTYLSLVGMNLTGEIPPFLATSTSLTFLDLSHNRLTGQIPNWLMNLTQLEWLVLQDNQLTGSIPSEISQLVNLVTLAFNTNAGLHANFDAFLQLRNLLNLDLSGVNLTFPSMNVGNAFASKLKVLYLNLCNLTEFPQFLHNQDELEELGLHSNNIQGLIPQWFLNVTIESLYILDLSDNYFTGFEQPDMLRSQSHLEVLDLDDNQLQGSLPIPPSSIVTYSTSNNQLKGGLPHQICHSSLMTYFDVSFNNLSGHIPTCIGELGYSLAWLNLKGNHFSGNIPHTYPASCKLKMIDLSQNQLEGKLPRALANCNDLEVLKASENHIDDIFPSWLGSLPNLHILLLRQNKFHGEIGSPKSSLDFPYLHIIDLSKNFFAGDLPLEYLRSWDAMKVTSESQTNISGIIVNTDVVTPTGIIQLPQPYDYSITITNKGNNMVYEKLLTVFRVIDFSSNNFTGMIPDVIGELRGLQALNLSHNNLHGRIPLSLADMTDLESLDLSNNKLSGEIPQGLTQLTSLEVFNVSHNLLEGPIPQGNQFGTFDESSFDGNSGLCGMPLPRECGNADESPTTPSNVESDDDDNSDHLIDWIVRCLGCVSGFVVGCALGKYFTDRHHEWFVETFKQKRKPKRKVRREAGINRR